MAIHTNTASLVYSPELAAFDLGPNHPLKPIRYAHTVELMGAAGVFDAPGVHTVSPRPASHAEIERFHDPDYVDVVRAIGAGVSLLVMIVLGAVALWQAIGAMQA